MAGPSLDDENYEAVIEQKKMLRGAPEAKTGTFWLAAVSRTGTEVVSEPGGPALFLPWGAVLKIYSGLSREKVEESYREARASSDAAGEGNPT